MCVCSCMFVCGFAGVGFEQMAMALGAAAGAMDSVCVCVFMVAKSSITMEEENDFSSGLGWIWC